MRDNQTFFDVLSFPTDLDITTGSGIVIDGPSGSIKVYRNGVLIGVWDSNSFRVLNPGTSSVTIDPDFGGGRISGLLIDPTDSPGIGDYAPTEIWADYINADETPFLGLLSPGIPGQSQSRIDLFGDNTPIGGVFPHINIAPNAGGGVGGYVDIPYDGAAKTSDFRIGNKTVGRGKVNTQEILFNSVGYIADGATDMFLNNQPIIAGREYEIWLHTKYGLSAAGQWSVGCHINGTRIAEFDIINEGAATTKILDGTVLWHPTVTQSTDDITVELDEFGGASTLTLQASADAPRWLTLKDTGV